MLRPRVDLRALVGSQPVLPLVVIDRTDRSRKADIRQNRDGSNGKHQAGVFWFCPVALGPQVFVGKGSSPVGFDISQSAGEVQSLTIQDEHPIQSMPHADHAMGAFQFRNESKWPHNIGLERSQRAVPKVSMQRQAAELYLQRDSFFAEGVGTDRDPQRLSYNMKFCFRILQPPSASLSDNLKRCTSLAATVPMNRRDQSNGSSIFRPALKIPALKIRSACFILP